MADKKDSLAKQAVGQIPIIKFNKENNYSSKNVDSVLVGKNNKITEQKKNIKKSNNKDYNMPYMEYANKHGLKLSPAQEKEVQQNAIPDNKTTREINMYRKMYRNGTKFVEQEDVKKNKQLDSLINKLKYR